MMIIIAHHGDKNRNRFRKLLSVYVLSYFPFGFEGRIWDLIVSVPDHCLSFYFETYCKKVRSFHPHPPELDQGLI